ncbi:MAG TPA: GFA family protein [Pseudolabrys sp.]|nr:GFA family protein [Pseudolabrys sp.]
MTQTYQGGCQCGNVRYEVALELGTVMSCNCSRCGKLGTLLAFAPAADFKLLAGEDATSEYLFNKKAVQHLFCSTCGIESFARGKRPGDGADVVAINVRCLDGVDPDSLTVKRFDGRNL